MYQDSGLRYAAAVDIWYHFHMNNSPEKTTRVTPERFKERIRSDIASIEKRVPQIAEKILQKDANEPTTSRRQFLDALLLALADFKALIEGEMAQEPSPYSDSRFAKMRRSDADRLSRAFETLERLVDDGHSSNRRAALAVSIRKFRSETLPPKNTSGTE